MHTCALTNNSLHWCHQRRGQKWQRTPDCFSSTSGKITADGNFLSFYLPQTDKKHTNNNKINKYFAWTHSKCEIHAAANCNFHNFVQKKKKRRTKGNHQISATVSSLRHIKCEIHDSYSILHLHQYLIQLPIRFTRRCQYMTTTKIKNPEADLQITTKITLSFSHTATEVKNTTIQLPCPLLSYT